MDHGRESGVNRARNVYEDVSSSGWRSEAAEFLVEGFSFASESDCYKYLIEGGFVWPDRPARKAGAVVGWLIQVAVRYIAGIVPIEDRAWPA
jgi:hypothetical protein